jgi:hypothetical protein
MTKIFSLLAIVFSIGCSSDINVLEEIVEPTPELQAVPGDTDTEFVIGANSYVTPKAYLLVDDAVGDFERAFTFVFSDGDIIEDGSQEIAFETTTTNYTKITCNIIATKPTLAETSYFVWDPQTNPNGYLDIVMEGNNYSEHDITSFTNTSTVGTQTFGQIDASISYDHVAFPNGDSAHGHVFRINARTFDLATNTGTIDCSYSYVDDNNVTITGVFIGNYEILTAF